MDNRKKNERDRLTEYQKSVCVFGIRKNVFLEFEFTVGFKELTIELVMPYEAFKEFCETNHVSKIDCNADIQEVYAKLAAGRPPKLHIHAQTDNDLIPSQGRENTENVVQLGDFK